jgi:hypothetical protein
MEYSHVRRLGAKVWFWLAFFCNLFIALKNINKKNIKYSCQYLIINNSYWK